jgi:hypothetical protein
MGGQLFSSVGHIVLFCVFRVKYVKANKVQVSLVIRGRYVPLFWTANTEFADKKTHFDWKFGILNQYLKCDKRIRR